MAKRATYHRITEPRHLALFQAETARRVDVCLPMEYLERSKVIALMDPKTDQILGGYVLACEGPLRSFEQIPQELLEEHPLIKRKKSRCFEVNGLWLDPRAANARTRIFLYVTCFIHILKLSMRGKFYFVYSFDASKTHLERLYSQFHSDRVFYGEVKMLPGMSDTAIEIVEIGSLKKIGFALFRHPGFFVKRMRKKRRRAQEATA